MIRIYLTDFVDIASKVGTPKFTKVRQIKERPDYEPAFDFYRPLREKIIEAHVKNYPKKYLDVALKELHDRKKLTNYPAVVSYN